MDIANLNKKVDLSEGRWIDDIPDNPNLRLLVRSPNYRPFRDASSGLSRRFGKKLDTDAGRIDFTIALGGLMAEFLLLDWDGVTNNGKPVKYDPKFAVKLLSADDPSGIGAHYRTALDWAASSVAKQLAEVTEEASGN